MSRRPPNPSAERAAKNQATIKSLLKLEANKTCADCKRNKHPRWASWSLGVFICIRCSGIHRGMGVHISKVKSVDLDSWTDEQMQQMLSWGNARANKYWEARLADNHVPSEAKIENFIRTKYELKRWVMDGPIPDPATLDDEAATDDQPLSVVQQDIKRKESLSKPTNPRSVPPVDLIGDSDMATPPPPPRASTTEPPSRVPPKSTPAPPKQTTTRDTLLGLDFFGTVEAAAPPRPASTTGTSSAQSRPDLKQSILSLYASAPRPQPQPQAPPPSASFGGMSPAGNIGQHQSQGSFGGLNDAFSSLSFGGSAAPVKSPPAGNNAFSSLGNFAGARPSSQTPKTASSAFSGLSGGSFFDTKPATPQAKTPGTGSSFGGFGAFASPKPAPPSQSSSTAFGDLFGLSSPAPAAAAPAPATLTSIPSPPSNMANSVFNLSAKQAAPAPATATTAAATGSFSSAGLSNADVWGSGDSSNAWATSAAVPKMSAPPAPAAAATTTTTTTANDFGWGGPMGGASSLANQPIVVGASGTPKVAADEEFGGWASSTDVPAATSSTGAGTAGAGKGAPSRPVGFGGNDDLFSNVWQ